MDLPTLTAAVLFSASPLMLAALGECLSEKGGVVNLSLDGSILLSAMTAFAAARHWNAVWPGFLAAAGTGMAVAAVVALMGEYLRVSRVAVGLVLAFFCRDLAYFAGNSLARLPGPQVEHLNLPLLADLPLAGPALFRQPPTVYAAVVLTGLVWWYMEKTRPGLLLRAAGESPEACWARGHDPERIRLFHALAGGALCGLAGAAYSLCVKPGWGRPQGCEGIGWIALALVIFGGWRPLHVAAGALFFALLQVMGLILQEHWTVIPAQVFQTAPFPLMILSLVLVHHAGKGKGGRAALLARLSGSPPTALDRIRVREG